jgi:hypothetical protein
MEIVYNTLIHHYQVQAEVKKLPQKDKLNIYLVQWNNEIERIQGEYAILMNYIKEKGHKCNVIDPNKLIIENGYVKSPAGDIIDLIYRRFTADELPKYADKGWQMAIDLNNANVAVVNPFCTKRVDSKNIMVLFKDEQYTDIFPDNLKNDLEVVRKIIPWTKKIDKKMFIDNKEVNGSDWLIENKNRIVIKHANAYSSSAVFLGEDADEKKWNEIVETALKGDWIVQHLINLPKIEIGYWEDEKIKKMECIYNVNPYMYDGKLGGFYIRASTDKLTSFTVGDIATVIPCLKKTKLNLNV